MKFITEEYLRILYKKEAFSMYKLNQGERLTPGAHQYLSDKGIKLITELTIGNNESFKQSNSEILKNNANINKKVYLKLKSIESLFLITGSEFIKEDIFLAQAIIDLEKKIVNIRNSIKGICNFEKPLCKECTGIKIENFCDDIDDCFEITEFHMQLEKREEILKLNMLRCLLREANEFIAQSYQNNNDLVNEIIKNINFIINSLSQLICLTIGGERCQRKN
ncbi:hypothetical protein UT300005_09190 [Clostridium sp. CTA-5]